MTNAEITAASIIIHALDQTPEGLANQRYLAKAIESAGLGPISLPGGTAALEAAGFVRVTNGIWRLTPEGAAFIDGGMRWPR
jgi:hypothetical protein